MTAILVNSHHHLSCQAISICRSIINNPEYLYFRYCTLWDRNREGAKWSCGDGCLSLDIYGTWTCML